MPVKKRAPKNRTITLSAKEKRGYSKKLITLSNKCRVTEITNKIVCQDVFKTIDFLPDKFVDLLIVDPPYNLYKVFNSVKFNGRSIDAYAGWVDQFILKIIRLLKPSASVYFCSEWYSSTSVHLVLNKYFNVKNRITWEREKGRGAKTNWKNTSEDIWFCTMNNSKYTFNPEAVKLKRRVIAPYKDGKGKPKGWSKDKNGSFRETYPSNMWTDISIPFWSMPENTEHPTQKPEKLIAKLILASTKKNQMVFDPFLGSGTTAATARKLGRRFVGIEMDKLFACYAQKRIEMAEKDKTIQGFRNKVFWERNSLPGKKWR